MPKGGHREPLAYICLIHSSLINTEGGGRKTDRHRKERGRERRRERDVVMNAERRERGGRRADRTLSSEAGLNTEPAVGKL